MNEDKDGKRIETDGLASALENLAVYVYNEHPEARLFVAETIAFFDENGEKLWEKREEDLPGVLTETQAKVLIDRLRLIWREGFKNDPLSQSDWSERITLGIAIKEKLSQLEEALSGSRKRDQRVVDVVTHELCELLMEQERIRSS